MSNAFTDGVDGFSDIGRNCGCGSGVYVLVDQYHGKCGVCGASKLTQLGLNRQFELENPEEFERIRQQFINQK